MLKNITLHATAGQTVALVGPTGAGKSTLVNLLTRFYEFETGEIEIDGRPLTDIPRAQLRAAVGLVTQESFLFNGTVRDNLRLGRPEATDDGIARRRRSRQRARVHRADAGGPGHGRRRAWRQAQRGRKAAGVHRARPPQGPADPDPRRGDRQRGHADRTRHPGGAGPAHARADELCHRAPAEHRAPGGPDSGHGTRAHHRARTTPGTARAGGLYAKLCESGLPRRRRGSSAAASTRGPFAQSKRAARYEPPSLYK